MEFIWDGIKFWLGVFVVLNGLILLAGGTFLFWAWVIAMFVKAG